MSRVVSRTKAFAINHKCQKLGITVKLKQSHVLLHSKTDVKGSITVKNGLDLNCGDPVCLSEASKAVKGDCKHTWPRSICVRGYTRYSRSERATAEGVLVLSRCLGWIVWVHPRS